MKYLEVEPDAYYALVDAIVPHALLESLEDGVDNIKNLEAMDELQPNQQKDLQHYKEYLPALVKVLEWWTATGSPERRKIQEILHDTEEV
jgi:hypothetical protein